TPGRVPCRPARQDTLSRARPPGGTPPCSPVSRHRGLSTVGLHRTQIVPPGKAEWEASAQSVGILPPLSAPRRLLSPLTSTGRRGLLEAANRGGNRVGHPVDHIDRLVG